MQDERTAGVSPLPECTSGHAIDVRAIKSTVWRSSGFYSGITNSPLCSAFGLCTEATTVGGAGEQVGCKAQCSIWLATIVTFEVRPHLLIHRGVVCTLTATTATTGKVKTSS